MSSISPRSIFGRIAGPDSKLSFAAASSVITTILGAGGRFVIQVIIADQLGIAAYGRFVSLRAWGELAATFPNRGYHTTTVRFLPEYETTQQWPLYRGLLRHSLRLTLGGGLVLGAGLALLGAIFLDDPILTLVLAGAAVPAWAGARMLQSITQAQHQFATATFIMQLFQPGVVAVGLVAIWIIGRELSLNWALGLLFGSVALAGVIGFVVMRLSTPADARGTANADIETDLITWRTSARHLYFSQLAIAVIGMADILILDLFASSEQVALYSIASRIAVLGRMVNSGLESIVAPRIAAAWTNNNIAGIERSVQSAIGLSTIPTIGLAIFLMVFRDPILGVVGDEYRAGGTVLVILLVGNVVNALTGPSGYVVSLTGREQLYARIMVGSAALMIVGGLAVAGPFGIVGMAILKTVVNVVWNGALVVEARRKLGVRCYPTRDLVDGVLARVSRR